MSASADADYFDDIPDEEIPNDMLDLAVHIVNSKTTEFDPSTFKDRYEEAVVDIIRKKQQGQTITAAPPSKGPAKVINLMDALRRSMEEKAGKPAPAKRSSARRSAAAHKRAPAKRSGRQAG